jgi:GT2 family glycosyltransferase
MLLSVIIVSYEVKYFLEQCLCSVNAACKQLEKEKGPGLAEIIVVDNNSGDGSVQYLEGKFEGVKFYRNNENLGFGRANNRALQMAKGEFVLFLNPDTILPEKIFY